MTDTTTHTDLWIQPVTTKQLVTTGIVGGIVGSAITMAVLNAAFAIPKKTRPYLTDLNEKAKKTAEDVKK